MTACVYDAETNEPAWVQSIASTTASAVTSPDTSLSTQTQQIPRNAAFSSAPTDLTSVNCPPGLTWLFAQELPPRARLHTLLEAYFNNVQPIRVFAFEHKPTFMRMLDEGQLTDPSGQALLHIMCALGARFYALEYSESFAPLSKELIQNAGTQWAKIAEEMFFADYSTISTTKLKVLILLHDQEARTGNYAGSFLLTGLVIRMAHALQLNNEASTDIMCKEDGPNEASIRECQRRLMWACYMLDVWAGSGVDHLTILNEKDIKIQLPCNERQFLLQIPVITERLEEGTTLDFIPKSDLPEKPRDNLGMAAYYVRIVSIWRRVLRFSKHMNEEQPPWEPGSEFSQLIEEVQSWKASLPSWLDFSADNIYIRRESHQLGALFLNHCMYHHVLCDIHRIALPDLYRNQQPYDFPPEQHAFMSRLQNICFEHAQLMSVLVATILQHGIKHFADPILPSFVYNSNRIMLYHIARILDLSKPDSRTVISRTIELVQQNNKALREMSLMYPLAEPLYITTERWLETVRSGLARGQASTYIAPQDPSEVRTEVQQAIEASSPNLNDIQSAQRNAQVALLPPGPNGMGQSPSTASDYYPTPSIDPMASSLATLADVATQPGQLGQVLPNDMSSSDFDQPVINLDDLQNFFEWETSNGEYAQLTGFEGFGPLGWANNFSTM
ncbi:hypothetical protein N0V87_009236 [Didymella glomerata]|uniref:Xylanolytic transcriptional activator regulatory domain-containing protein n=1 Tax=Didymella glomerata TaxID=749621 RepID=A0A9W8WRJ2_9PLEO|nr:hypothetical protein N0V87_009236 [Didymella glomerata]